MAEINNVEIPINDKGLCVCEICRNTFPPSSMNIRHIKVITTHGTKDQGSKILCNNCLNYRTLERHFQLMYKNDVIRELKILEP